jgi:uncharacterized protein (TIGR00369 family)
MPIPQPGTTAAATLVVTEQDTAPALGSGDVPVLGTPRVVALCEEATVRAAATALAADETTVGTRVEVDHLAPSRVGDTVTASATVTEVEGRRIVFSVSLADPAGRRLAAGRVWRVLVDRERFTG